MCKTKLLIVDDEVIILESLKDMLEDDVDIIHLAENGKEALEQIEKNGPFNCIISDIKMPVMNGIEFIRQLREQKDDSLVVFFTSHGSRELMFEAVKYGAFEFINKPNFDNLNEIVKATIKYSLLEDKDMELDVISEYNKLLKSTDIKNS